MVKTSAKIACSCTPRFPLLTRSTTLAARSSKVRYVAHTIASLSNNFAIVDAWKPIPRRDPWPRPRLLGTVWQPGRYFAGSWMSANILEGLIHCFWCRWLSCRNPFNYSIALNENVWFCQARNRHCPLRAWCLLACKACPVIISKHWRLKLIWGSEWLLTVIKTINVPIAKLTSSAML